MILPRRNENLRNLAFKKDNITESYEKALDKLANLIKIELFYINKLAIISEDLRNKREYTTYELFLLIDRNHEKYLNISNLSKFLNEMNKSYSDNEINDIIFRLYKLEKKNISYEDFQEILCPIKTLVIETTNNFNKNQTNSESNNNKDPDLKYDQISIKDEEAKSKLIIIL